MLRVVCEGPSKCLSPLSDESVVSLMLDYVTVSNGLSVILRGFVWMISWRRVHMTAQYEDDL